MVNPAASFGLIVLFPLAFVSNAMVPTQHMPGWLRAVADWNPVSPVPDAGPPAVGQSEPVRVHRRLADATPHRGVGRLVGADPRRGRAARVPPFPAPDNRVAAN